MPKVRVIKTFRDIETDVLHQVGEIVEFSTNRIKDIKKNSEEYGTSFIEEVKKVSKKNGDNVDVATEKSSSGV